MPELSGFPILDVVIGMTFLFFVLATVVSSINEVIQSVLNSRARNLARGLQTLLGDGPKADAILEHWHIKRLARPGGPVRRFLADRIGPVRDHRRPSYIPSRAFALAVVENAQDAGAGLLAKAQASVDAIGVPPLSQLAQTQLTEAQRRTLAIRDELERSFDEVMDRASGWYKRYVQWCLIVIAIGVTVGLNVSAYTIAERLWKDDALRAAIVDNATAAESSREEPATPQAVADRLDGVRQLGLPIGWSAENTEGPFTEQLLGWLVTIAAVSLGAPFWFDLLGKLSQLRGTGNREGTLKDDRRLPEDRDDPSRRRPA